MGKKQSARLFGIGGVLLRGGVLGHPLARSWLCTRVCACVRVCPAQELAKQMMHDEGAVMHLQASARY